MNYDAYPCSMKIMHWLVALLMIGVLIMGFLMTDVLPDNIRFNYYDWHKSFGLTVFGLGLVRIVIRLTHKVPPMHSSVRLHERVLAHSVYGLFYILMIAFPLSGYIMSSAGGHPVAWFGIPIPMLIAKNPEIGGIARELHEIFGYTLAGLILVHTAGVVVHKVRDGVNVLRRMI